MTATVTSATEREPEPTPAARPAEMDSGRTAVRPPVIAGWFEPVLVGYVLTGLVFAVFWGHLTGAKVPPLDFLGHYNTDSFAWWRDGGFFDPPQWMSYMWGGYPSVMDAQNSSFYIPVGIAAELFTFDLHTSAVVSVLHVAFGALGMYVLTRRLGMAAPVALVGLVAWFFIGPFFSAAQHLDIMRSYAWLPWIMLVLSPRWPWRRWWGMPLAGLVLWQGLLSMYPGILIAGVYTLPLWVLGMQLVHRPRVREFLLPAAVSLLAAGAMLMLRYLPFVLIRGGTSSPRGYNSSQWSWGFLSTTLYPYDVGSLPNDVPFRSFFVGAVILAALTATSWRNRLTLVCLPIAAVAVLLGVPTWPWSSAVRELPGLDISRFLMSDFKPYLLVSVVLIGLTALADLWRAANRRALWPPPPLPERTRAGSAWPSIRGGAVLVALAVALGWSGEYANTVWVSQAVLLAVAVTGVVLLARAAAPSAATGLVLALAVTAAASGIVAVRASTQMWDTDRRGDELVYGQPVDSLIASRADPDTLLERRPARIEPTKPVDIYAVLAPWQNRVHYTGGFAVAGYITMAGSGAYDKITFGLLDQTNGATALAFWAAPGMGLASDDAGIPDAGRVAQCAATRDCGTGLSVTPVSFQASGTIVYDIVAENTSTMVFNEAYYPGWVATACATAGGACVDVPLSTGSGGQVVAAMPAGDWRVTFHYSIPGQTTSWVLFWLGVAVLLAGGAVRLVPSRTWRTLASAAARRGRRPVPQPV